MPPLVLDAMPASRHNTCFEVSIAGLSVCASCRCCACRSWDRDVRDPWFYSRGSFASVLWLAHATQAVLGPHGAADRLRPLPEPQGIRHGPHLGPGHYLGLVRRRLLDWLAAP